VSLTSLANATSVPGLAPTDLGNLVGLQVLDKAQGHPQETAQSVASAPDKPELLFTAKHGLGQWVAIRHVNWLVQGGADRSAAMQAQSPKSMDAPAQEQCGLSASHLPQVVSCALSMKEPTV
jgi:hypothetical protein